MSDSDSKGIVVYKVSDIIFSEPMIIGNAKDKVITEIANAWKKCTIIDNKGWLWVEKDKLNSILRTRKNSVNEIVMRIEDKYKWNDGKKVYIRGFVILSLIAKAMEEGGVGTKGTYLDVSMQYYDAINKSEKSKLLRLEYDKALVAERKSLKDKRKRKYKIKLDELTGEKLKKFSEFSHIRSVALYKEIADSIDNGLVVNKTTHEIITARGINNEEELKKLCQENNWNLGWYEKYKKNFEF